MAYKKEFYFELAGSLNLLPPFAKIPPEDALQLKNFRPDQIGMLRSRRGILRINTGAETTPNDIHTLANRSASIGTYLGAGQKLWTDNGGTLLYSAYDGQVLGIVSFSGFGWIMNQAAQHKHSAAGVFTAWAAAAPTTAPTVGKSAGQLTGDFFWAVTYANAAGHESNPSPFTATETMAAEQADLTSVPLSPDTQITKRHIYRGGGTQEAILRVGTINDNTTTTFSDTLTEDDATALGIELELDHDGPPAARGLAGPFFNRLIAFNSAANPNRYWWTPINRPWYFPGSASTQVGNWNDVGAADTPIYAITQHGRVLVFYKSDSIWRLAGDPGTSGDQVQTSATSGVLGPGAVAAAGQVDYFAGPEGIFVFTGDREIKISEQIDPIFQGFYTTVSGTEAAGVQIPPMSQDVTVRSRAILAYENGRVWFSYAEEGVSWNSITLVYHVDKKRWVHHELDDALPDGGFRAFLYDATANKFYGSLRNGFFYQLDTGLTDAGGAIPIIYQTRYHEQNLPDNLKVYEDVVIDAKTHGDSINVVALFDSGISAEVVLGTLQSTDWTKVVFPINDGEGRRSRNVSIRIGGDTDSGVEIRLLGLHYIVGPRESQSFDSYVIDLGIENVKQLSELEFDLESSAAMTYEIHSDLPGGVMAQRLSATLANASGRRLVKVRLASLIEGRRLRLFMVSQGAAQQFVLYGVRFRILALGEYIDGASSDFFETQDLDFG